MPDAPRTPAEACPTCGQPVTVVTSDDGTSHYTPAAADEARVAELLDTLARDVPQLTERVTKLERAWRA